MRASLSYAFLRAARAVIVAVGAAAIALACSPSIGDKCTLSTDCSSQGDRLCDTSQPNGYCTQLNCIGNKCADQSVCVLFNAATPGCAYTDRSGPNASRIARSFCMAECTKNSDCREHYICADPRTSPWSAVILDDNQGRKNCLPAPIEDLDASVSATPAPVCGSSSPAVSVIDAGASTIYDAGVTPPPLFSSDAGADGG